MGAGKNPKAQSSYLLLAPLFGDLQPMQAAGRELQHNFLHEVGGEEARTGAQFFARRRQPRSTNWSTIFCTKKAATEHELEHNLLHEEGSHGARTGAQFVARRRQPRSTNWSTIFCTKKAAKEHELRQTSLQENEDGFLRTKSTAVNPKRKEIVSVYIKQNWHSQ